MAFRHNVCDIRLREELAYREPTTTKELYALASKCERMEEGHRAPELALKDQEEAKAPKKKKRKREDRHVLAVGKGEVPITRSPQPAQPPRSKPRARAARSTSLTITTPVTVGLCRQSWMHGSGASLTGAGSRGPTLTAGPRGTLPGNVPPPGTEVPGGRAAKDRAQGQTQGDRKSVV